MLQQPEHRTERALPNDPSRASRKFVAEYDTLPLQQQRARRGEYLSLQIAFLAEELLHARDGQNGFLSDAYDGDPDRVTDPAAREILQLLRLHNRAASSGADAAAIHRVSEEVLMKLRGLRTPQDRIELSAAAKAFLDPA
jgi:hypothetical protein